MREQSDSSSAQLLHRLRRQCAHGVQNLFPCSEFPAGTGSQTTNGVRLSLDQRTARRGRALLRTNSLPQREPSCQSCHFALLDIMGAGLSNCPRRNAHSGASGPQNIPLGLDGFELVQTGSLARKRWKWAVQCITRQYRLRSRFHTLAEWTKLDRVQANFSHLERLRGEIRYKNKQVPVERMRRGKQVAKQSHRAGGPQ